MPDNVVYLDGDQGDVVAVLEQMTKLAEKGELLAVVAVVAVAAMKKNPDEDGIGYFRAGNIPNTATLCMMQASLAANADFLLKMKNFGHR